MRESYNITSPFELRRILGLIVDLTSGAAMPVLFLPPERGNVPGPDRHPFGLRPTAPARISMVRHSNLDPVYLRATAGTSPVVAGQPALHADAIYTSGQLLEKPRGCPV